MNNNTRQHNTHHYTEDEKRNNRQTTDGFVNNNIHNLYDHNNDNMNNENRYMNNRNVLNNQHNHDTQLNQLNQHNLHNLHVDISDTARRQTHINMYNGSTADDPNHRTQQSNPNHHNFNNNSPSQLQLHLGKTMAQVRPLSTETGVKDEKLPQNNENPTSLTSPSHFAWPQQTPNPNPSSMAMAAPRDHNNHEKLENNSKQKLPLGSIPRSSQPSLDSNQSESKDELFQHPHKNRKSKQYHFRGRQFKADNWLTCETLTVYIISLIAFIIFIISIIRAGTS